MSQAAQPAPEVDAFTGVFGQEAAVRALRSAAVSPVHAYMLVGAPGSGKRALARAFTAAVLCPDGGCGRCAVCLQVAADSHPEVTTLERQGPFITVDTAREIRRLAMRTPGTGDRKVIVLPEFHLVQHAAPALLKIVEEPPPSTVFVLLADHVPPELITVASRCVVIHLAPLTIERVEAALVAEGVSAEVAARVAPASVGRLDRARLLASDPGFESRLAAWKAVPGRLDGTGATVAAIAGDLVAMLSSAAVAPLEARHEAEQAEVEARVEQTGERGSGRKDLVERHRRELRRLRIDELRFGLGVLAGAYRDALVEGRLDGALCCRGLEAVQEAAEALVRNPSEPLLLQALLLRLPPVNDA